MKEVKRLANSIPEVEETVFITTYWETRGIVECKGLTYLSAFRGSIDNNGEYRNYDSGAFAIMQEWFRSKQDATQYVKELYKREIEKAIKRLEFLNSLSI